MAVKLTVVFLAVALFLMLTWEPANSSIVRRESPATSGSSDASQSIDDAIQSFKSGVDDLVKKIQGNDLYQNVTHALKQFGDTVQQQGKQLVDKIQGEKSSN